MVLRLRREVSEDVVALMVMEDRYQSDEEEEDEKEEKMEEEEGNMMVLFNLLNYVGRAFLPCVLLPLKKPLKLVDVVEFLSRHFELPSNMGI